METNLCEAVGEVVLPADAARLVDDAVASIPEPLCTPAATPSELRAALQAGMTDAGRLVGNTRATAPMPGDVALVGALVKLALPRRDITVEGNAACVRLADAEGRGPVCVPGTLHVRGDLRVVSPMVVCGDLVVDGGIVDCGPQSVIVVLGNLRCRALRTSSEVMVLGDLHARTFVWGHYNDNVLEVHGTLVTPVLMSDDHAIEANALELVHRPPVRGVWGPDIFDMMESHTNALRELLVDASLVEDIEQLASVESPWKS